MDLGGRSIRPELILSAALALTCGCGGNSPERLSDRGRAELAVTHLATGGFLHELRWSEFPPLQQVYVFIEGDGSPWSEDGRHPTPDPTPHEPLALELAEVSAAHAVLYVGRPCYFGAHSDPACTPDLWTAARYSARVVDSMATVVNRYVEEHGFTQVVLVGYSGGGALAVLMAPEIPRTRAVITIAANLDVAAWTHWHGYLPLTESLDPATQPPLGSSVLQIHLVGGHDSNVPEPLGKRYLQPQTNPTVWRFPDFDHVCCWVRQWPSILHRLDAMITDSTPEPRADR